MRNLVVIGVVVVVAAAVAVMLWRRSSEERVAPAATREAPAGDAEAPVSRATVPASPGAPSAPSANAGSAGPPSSVRKLERGERERLAAQIARAHAASAAAPPASAAGSAMLDRPEQALGSIMAALDEIKPFMVECHEAETARRGSPVPAIRAGLTLVGDADVGALIDASEVTGADGQPLFPSFAECLRETLLSLALPPVVDGRELKISMTWTFDE